MWRPGAPAPPKSGKSKKGSKSKKNDKKSDKKAPKSGKKSKPESEPFQKREKQTDDDSSFVRTGDGRLTTALESNLVSATNARLSSSVKNLRFMARKEEQRQQAQEEATRLRKLREDKWIIDPSLIETESGGLVCQPLQTAPRRMAGRRSFGKFNLSVENFQEHQVQEEKDDAVRQRIDREAISAEEMADAYEKNKANSGKRQRPAVSGKTAKRRRTSNS